MAGQDQKLQGVPLMKNNQSFVTDGRFKRLFPFAFTFLLLFAGVQLLTAQTDYKYRAFTEAQLVEKAVKVEKNGANGCFVFVNSLSDTAFGIYMKFNAVMMGINSPMPFGGFHHIIYGKGDKSMEFTEGAILAGDTSELCFQFSDNGKDTEMVTQWWWLDKYGNQLGNKNSILEPTGYSPTYSPANGGFVADYVFKNYLKSTGLIIGIPANAKLYGWIKYTQTDRKDYPLDNTSDCLNPGVIKNPTLKNMDNALVGALYAAKIAIIANDSGLTEPQSPAPKLGDLIFDDTSSNSPYAPFNGYSLRELCHLADSALTFCAFGFERDGVGGGGGVNLGNVLEQIFQSYVDHYGTEQIAVESLNPLLLSGSFDLQADSVLYLHAPGSISLSRAHGYRSTLSNTLPDRWVLNQNYPNPFNPTTQISFMLPQASIVTLRVYNILGQEVATLLNNSPLNEGEQHAVFNASNYPSGVYFYRISTQGTDGKNYFQDVKRMVLIK
jgi:hypothetical protein